MNKYSLSKSRKKYRKKTGKPSLRKNKKQKLILARGIKKTLAGLKFTACAALILGAIGLAVGGTYHLYKSNDLFILRDVVCEGNRQLSRSDVLNVLPVELGTRLLDVPVEQMETSLAGHPWIEKAKVRRRYPSRLKIQLQEKKPVALCYLSREKAERMGFFPGSETALRGSRWYGISAAGELLPDITLKDNILPVIEIPRNKMDTVFSDMCRFLSLAQREYTGLYNTMSQITFQDNEDFAIYSRDNRLKFLVSMEEDFDASLGFWDLLISSNSEKFSEGQTVDLRVEGFAYVR